MKAPFALLLLLTLIIMSPFILVMIIFEKIVKI